MPNLIMDINNNECLEYAEFPGVEEGVDRKLVFTDVKWLRKNKFEKMINDSIINEKDCNIYPCLNEESKVEFLKLMQHEELKSSTILIFANKQDLDSAKPIQDLITIYGLDKIKDKVWHIQPCSAKTGEGLMAGLKWLSEQLIYKKNTRFPKNPYLTSKRNLIIYIF